jgi:RecA/RadA recombinase
MAKKAKKIDMPTDFMLDIAKEMGDKNLDVMSDNTASLVPWRVPFTHLGLQAATGGLIGGGIMQIEGESQSGKSFLLYELVANAIKMNGAAFLADPEQAYEPAYGTKMGIGGTGFLYSNSNDMEKTFEQYMKFIKLTRDKYIKDASRPIVIGVDSFVPWRSEHQLKADEKGEKAGRAYQIKNEAFYDCLGKLQPLLKDYAASFVILNQLRQDNTIMFGDKDKTQAEGVKYFLNQRLRGKLGKKIIRIVEIKGEDGKKAKNYIQTGMTTNWTVVKNRFVEPFKQIQVQILFRKGLKPYSGLDRFLLREGDVTVIDKPFIKADGSEGKKVIEMFQPKGTDSIYEKNDMQNMVEAHPWLIEPKWTQKIDDSEYEEIEADDESMGEE